jgi:hypothetical protein
MKKSSLVAFGAIMAALILSACGEDRRCVDPDGFVVEDEKCRKEEKDQARTGSRGTGVFRWYYGGSGHTVGSRVSGGSHSSVSRGGFGRLGFLHGSGSG